MLLVALSLLAGALTILAPCTISLLPVIVGGSFGGTRSIRRAVTVTVALGLAVIVFTLVLKVSTLFITVPPVFWQLLSGGIIVALGIVTVFPGLYEKLPFLNTLNRSSNALMSTGYTKQTFWGDVLVGVALGPVFSSCSPTYFLIVATVLPRNLLEGLLYLSAYALGLCVALLVATLAGQKILLVLGVAADPRGWFKQLIGVLFIVVGAAILFGYDKKLQLIAANTFFDVTGIEQRFLQVTDKEMSDTPRGEFNLSPAIVANASMRVSAKGAVYSRAPEITLPHAYINTQGKPITIGEFVGKKVVLVDFWTYSCINCQRTIPYLNAWYQKYRDQGLEIIGVHTPEFAFEKVPANVKTAIKKSFSIEYPVVLDNTYGTWNAFGNRYWPRKYLVDIDGFVVYDHIGEGEYAETERAIKRALAERATVLGLPVPTETGVVTLNGVSTPEQRNIRSKETYFGADRNEFLGNGTQNVRGEQTFVAPQKVAPGTLYFSKIWNITDESAVNTEAGARIIYTYSAKDVYFVASSEMGVVLKIILDGKPLGEAAGADVAPDSTMRVLENRLYKVIKGLEYGEHTLEIEVSGPGLEAYTLTFG